jgi:hypothetical protein
MKKIVAVLFLLLCAATLRAKPNPADFNIKIHISGSQVIPALLASDPDPFLFVDTVLGGKKVKLGGYVPFSSHHVGSIAPPYSVLNPGDYQIRLKKDDSEKDSPIIRQKYELLLPNGDVWECSIVGISE